MSETPDIFFIFSFIIARGLPTTLLITAVALSGGFVLGILLALMRIYGPTELKWFASGYEKLLRGLPLVVLILIFATGIPAYLLPINIEPYWPLLSVFLALSLRSGAYQSQIFRSAILSVNPGQLEAARSLGMSSLGAFRRIILPQALRLAIPSWSNEYSVVIKDSSFAYVIGIIEMTRASTYVYNNYPELFSIAILVVTLLYFLFTYPVTRIFGETQAKKLRKMGIGGN
jgi:polar amino acid transport system permease protein